jgi:hypothetical protein
MLPDTCAYCHESFDEMGLLPDERFVAVDGSPCCCADCVFEYNAEVWESDAYPVIPCDYLD